MGRRRKRGKKHRDPDPEDVLAGRAEIRGDDLFQLIHQVNPTSRGLDARDEERLYSQKNRLQALLVRRFPELVTVRPTGEDGVVSLAHRSGLRDACHAVVDELEPDARAWVRRQLDLRATPEPEDDAVVLAPAETADGGEPASADELVARAEQAVRDYEYDVAERCLVEALEASRGALSAALPLLELRVDLLGTDEQALAVEPRLGSRTREDSRVRGLLALAAARLGEEERALGLVKGAESGRAADVYAALAHGAGARRDREAAERFLHLTETRAATHPDLLRLRGEIAELVAADSRPAEDALAERYRREGALAVEEEARALLDSWGQSEIARRVLQEAGELKRRQEAADALEAAAAALGEDRFRDAQKHFLQALAAGSDFPALAERAAEAGRRAAEREDAEHVDDAVRGFAEVGDERAVHLGYLVLSAPLRSRVRERVERPTPGWLEELDAPPSGPRARAAVAAVLALERAAALPGDDPQAILDTLEPHQKTLAAVDLAVRLHGEAGERLAAARRRRAREALGAAREAAERGRLDLLRRRLGEVEAGNLDDGGRDLYEKLRERLAHGETLTRVTVEYEHRSAEDDLLGARDRAESLAAMAAGEDSGSLWRERADGLRARIRAEWAIEVDERERPLSEVRDFLPDFWAGGPQIWLDDDGGEMILADLRYTWLFLRVVDLRSQRLVARVSIHPPELVGRFTLSREGDLVRIADDSGTSYLELRRADWDVVRAVSPGAHLPADAVVEEVTLLPGTPYLWIDSVDSGGESLFETRCQILDLRTGRVLRDRSNSTYDLLYRPGEPWLTCQSAGTGARIFNARGVEVPGWELPGDLVKYCLVADDRLLTVDEEKGDEEKGDEELVILELWERGAASPGAALRIPGSLAYGSRLVAVSSAHGLAFLLLDAPDTKLVAVSISGEVPEERYRVPFPWDAMFVQDRWGRHLYAVYLDERHFHAVPLGASPPEPAGHLLRASPERRIPAFEGPYPCELVEVTSPYTAFWEGTDTPEKKRRFLERFEDDPYSLLGALFQQRRLSEGLTEIADDLRALLERRPEHDGVRYALANWSADAARWGEVHRLLAPLSLEEVDSRLRCHWCHLLALALLAEGRPREARQTIEDGLRDDKGKCKLDLARTLAEVLARGELGDEERTVERPFLWQLVGAVQAADRALAAGDFAAAAAELDRPAVWGAHEAQSAARLAAACLGRLPAKEERRWGTPRDSMTPEQIFLSRYALAAFLEAHRAQGEERREIFVPGSDPEQQFHVLAGAKRRCLDVAPLAWDRERLDELAEEAHDWLVKAIY